MALEIPKIPETFGEIGKTSGIPEVAAEAISRNLPLALKFDALLGVGLGIQEGAKGNVRFTDERKVKYLMFLSKTGQIHRSSTFAGVTYATIQNARKDPKFAEAEAEAKLIFQESLENEALKRAIDGWEENVYQKGELVGTVHRKSERMLELLLKANLPEKFRENVKIDANVNNGVLVVAKPLEDGDWEKEYGGKTIDGTAQEIPVPPQLGELP